MRMEMRPETKFQYNNLNAEFLMGIFEFYSRIQAERRLSLWNDIFYKGGRILNEWLRETLNQIHDESRFAA